MNILNHVETFATGSVGILFIQALSFAEMESVYKMFVQSLVATAAIGKIVYDVLALRKARRGSRNVTNKKKS